MFVFMYWYNSLSKGLTTAIVPFATPVVNTLVNHRAPSNVKPIPIPSIVRTNLFCHSGLSGSVASLSKNHDTGPSNFGLSFNIAARFCMLGSTNAISTAPNPIANAPIFSPRENLPANFGISFVPVNNCENNFVPFTAIPAGAKYSVTN